MNFSNYQNLRSLFTAIGNKLTHRPETIEISQSEYNQLTQEQKADKSKVYYIYDADSDVTSLAELSDTSISNLSNGQLLSYDSTASKWKNVNPPADAVSDVQVNGLSVVNQQGVAQITVSVPNIEALNNVNVSNLGNGQILKYNSTSEQWENANESGGSGGVSDVLVDGTSVVTSGVANITTPDIDDLDSVDITTPSAGQVLAYDGTTSKWKNISAATPNISDLADTSITSLINGQILKYNATTEKWENTNEGGGASGMTTLSYGNSTWADFIAAYNTNTIVYCRASSNSDPASGSQTRMAFMAYVNNATNPTEVEFQYYRSVSSKSESNQGDQVFVYKITNAGTWTVQTRNTYTRIKAGTNITSSYSGGVLTLNSTASGGTTVVANPSGTASTDLTKLQVENTVYSIPTANLGDVDNFALVYDLPSDAASHPTTLYLIQEV